LENGMAYRFDVNGKTYTGNSRNTKLKPGDTILVKYVSDFPQINEEVD
jgi:hypothetical protein